MQRFLFAAAAIAVMSFSTNAMAQHSDIEFGYERDGGGNATGFEIEGDEITSDGFKLYESDFEELAGTVFTPDPGFAASPGEGLTVNEDDVVWLNIVDAALHSGFGVGFVNYYGLGDSGLSAVGEIEVTDDLANSLVLDGATASGVNPLFISIGESDGDAHGHVTFTLEDGLAAPVGAYGMMMQLQSDFEGLGGIDLTSEAFWIVLNNGMDEEDFENYALPYFGLGTAIPEPSSLLCLTGAACALALRRRRKV